MREVAIITGAGRGIGRAVAVELAKAKYRLALVSRSVDQLEETARICGGVETACFPADVSVSKQVDGAVEQTLAKFGRVDCLVHCAGMVVMGAIDKLSAEDWRAMMDTNLSAIYFFCHRLWPIWRKQGGGVVVNVSSQAARDPFDGLSAYGAAKAGVNLLGLALAREGKAINVRVHTVAPSATETAMFRSLMTPEEYPTEKTLEPAAVARVIAQCVQGDLDCTSGEVIYVHK